MGTLRSPNEFVEAAKEHMLDGREPQSHKDWQLVMNFIARNVDGETALSACRLMNMIYKMGLDDEDVESIVIFQLRARLEAAEHKPNPLLTPREQEAWNLWIECHDFDQVSLVMGITKSRARSYISTARAKVNG